MVYTNEPGRAYRTMTTVFMAIPISRLFNFWILEEAPSSAWSIMNRIYKIYFQNINTKLNTIPGNKRWSVSWIE